MKLSYVSDFYTVFRFYLPSDVLLLQGENQEPKAMISDWKKLFS